MSMIALLLLSMLAGPTEPVYQYRATVSRVIDGDTYELDLDLGFNVHVREHIRLFGWNCPERFTVDGAAATEKARTILSAAKVIIVERYKGVQSFARWVAYVWVDGVDIGELLAPACVVAKGPR